LTKKSGSGIARIDFYNQRTIEFDDETNSVRLIDQTALPTKLRFESCKTVPELITAIKTMQIRGAPAIGVAGAMGVAISFHSNRDGGNMLLSKIKKDADSIKMARPTAVNLAWGVGEALSFVETELANDSETKSVYEKLVDFVKDLANRDVKANKALSKEGAALIPNGARVLTHCN
jgi:methylthioribose-1-phosphate isomerase